MNKDRLAVVIPAFRAQKTIQKVVEGALQSADLVIVVNDASPGESGGCSGDHGNGDGRDAALYPWFSTPAASGVVGYRACAHPTGPQTV
jgi:hypothetical protein